MLRRHDVWTVGIVVLALCAPACVAHCEDLLHDAQGQPNLDRWQAYHHEPIKEVSDVWELNEGVLTCKGLPRGYLYTKAKYTNFELQMDWRWPPGSQPGKGGVLFRMTGENKVWPKSLEAQLNSGSEGDFVGLVGFQLSGPAERLETLEHPQFGKLTFLRKTEAVAKPAGQWNRLEVEARADSVTIRMNGSVVNQAMKCDVVAGPILLTAENDPIQFRNITLKPLDE